MNRAIARPCIFVVAVSILSGCAAPGPIGIMRYLSGEDQPPTAIHWKIKFDGSGSSPVIADGLLYVGSADGAIYALDPKTGETKWRFQTGESLSSGPNVITVPRGTSIDDQMNAGIIAAEKRRGEGIRRVDMTPAVENGTVFVGSGDHSFYAIDAATGKKKWSYAAGPGMASPNFSSITEPASVLKNGSVYVVTEDGLHALDVLTGKRKWLFETLQEIPIEQMNMRRKRAPEGPVLGDGVIFLTAWPYIRGDTPLKCFIYAVDPESGKAKWVTSMDGLDITAPTTAKGLAVFAVEEKPTLLARSDRVTLYAINASNGQVKWKFGAEKQWGTRPLLVADNTICFRTEKSLFALELETGRQLWSFSADEIGRSFQADDQHLYVVTHKGTMARPDDTIHVLAINTGHEKWSQSLSGSVRVAMVYDGVVYAGGTLLHAIDSTSGKELWSFKGTGRETARLISRGRIFLTSSTVTYFGTSRVDQGYLYAIDAKADKLKP